MEPFPGAGDTAGLPGPSLERPRGGKARSRLRAVKRKKRGKVQPHGDGSD